MYIIYIYTPTGQQPWPFPCCQPWTYWRCSELSLHIADVTNLPCENVDVSIVYLSWHTQLSRICQHKKTMFGWLLWKISNLSWQTRTPKVAMDGGWIDEWTWHVFQAFPQQDFFGWFMFHRAGFLPKKTWTSHKLYLLVGWGCVSVKIQSNGTRWAPMIVTIFLNALLSHLYMAENKWFFPGVVLTLYLLIGVKYHLIYYWFLGPRCI